MTYRAALPMAWLFLNAGAATLSACGSGGQQAAGGTAPDTPVAAAPAAFAQCSSCHSVQAGRNMLGPSLHGVTGRKAGSLAGFSYSPAMAAAVLTWDTATLDRFIAAPQTVVPGTRMSYAGMRDPAQRKAVMEYLSTLK